MREPDLKLNLGAPDARLLAVAAEAILSVVEEGVCGVDARGRVTFVNAAAERMLGRRAEAMVGRECRGSVWGEDGPAASALRSGAAKRGQAERFLRGDGSTFEVECAIEPFREEGEAVGSVLAFREVSRAVGEEEGLREYAAGLARANEDLEQFAYVASHDLQEPLRIVTGYLDLLKGRCGGKLGRDADEFIEYAVDAAGRMQGMIRALLEYSRVGTRGGAMGRVESAEALQEALSNLRVAVEESGVEVSVGDLPAVRADAAQLTQLFQNLISNSIKFRGVAPPRVEVGAERGDGEWRFWVRDNGVGFDPADAARAFLIFQRLHGREEYSGTGIGLAVCKKIVERHGGRIWAEGAVGRGATFRFTLPAAEEDRS